MLEMVVRSVQLLQHVGQAAYHIVYGYGTCFMALNCLSLSERNCCRPIKRVLFHHTRTMTLNVVP